MPRGAAVALALALALAAVPQALAEELRRVGVVVVLTVNATDERATELSEALGAAIAEELAVEVIAGAEADEIVASADVADGCVADPACVRELGERLEVAEILALVVVEVGDKTQIEPTWVDVASGRTASRAAMAFEGDDDPTELFRRQAPKLLPDAEPRPRGADGDEDEAAPPANEIVIDGDDGSTPARRRMTPAAWAAAGVGTAALGGGLGFWLSTRSLYRSCERGGCPKADGPRITRRAITADAFFTTAFITGGVAAALYWWSGSSGEKDLHIGGGPAELGLSVRGRF